MFSEILGEAIYLFIYYKLNYKPFILTKKEQEGFRRIKYLQGHKFRYLKDYDV